MLASSCSPTGLVVAGREGGAGVLGSQPLHLPQGSLAVMATQ